MVTNVCTGGIFFFVGFGGTVVVEESTGVSEECKRRDDARVMTRNSGSSPTGLKSRCGFS